MTLVRRCAELKDLILPRYAESPQRARSSEPDLCVFCARPHYCFHPGMATQSGQRYMHCHCCIVTHSHNAVSHSTPTRTHMGWLYLLFSQAVVCAASRGRRHTRNYHLPGLFPSALTGRKCSSSSALLLKSLPNPSPFPAFSF